MKYMIIRTIDLIYITRNYTFTTEFRGIHISKYIIFFHDFSYYRDNIAVLLLKISSCHSIFKKI